MPDTRHVRCPYCLRQYDLPTDAAITITRRTTFDGITVTIGGTIVHQCEPETGP